MRRVRVWPLLAIALISALISLMTPRFTAAEPPPSFLEQCHRPGQGSASDRQTLAVLLEVAGTTDCQTAMAHLQTLTTLDLSDRQLSSLTPLSGLTQLQTLYLNRNQLTDLTPLASLLHLTDLYLPGNQLTDLSPLTGLAHLSTLYLDDNLIRDFSPLSPMRSLTILYANHNQIETLAGIAQWPHLTELYLAGNRIADLQPLRSLQTLTRLNLGGNRITDIAPLAGLVQLVQLDLNDNQISQLGALTALTRLTALDLRNNPLPSKTCPVFPATLCVFTDDAADLYRQGQQHRQEGDWRAALADFRAALAIYQTGGDRLRESDALDRLGNVYDDLGQYANALDYYQQGAIIREAVGDRQGESDTLTYVGITSIRLGQTEPALEVLHQAWDLYQTLTPRDRSWLRPEPREGLILSSLALAYDRAGELPQALRFAKLSLASYRRGNDRAGEAIALTRVGDAYLNLGDRDKAQLYLDQALRLSQAQDDPAGLARSWYALGRLSARWGEPATALDYYQQAQQGQQRLGDPAGEGETLNAIGELLLQTGHQADAVQALRAAVALWESLRPGLTDDDKISIAETQAHTYRLLQKGLVALGEPGAALEIAERGRARAFAELLAHRLALRGQPSPLERSQPPTLAQIQQIAQAQTVTLVEYSWVEDELYIWVVDPSGHLHFRRQSLDGVSLADRLVATRTGLGLRGRGVEILPDDAAPDPAPWVGDRSLRQWHQLLIQPIAEWLPTDVNAPVVIIPQGELFLVPFPALVDPQGVALLEQHPLLAAAAIGLLASSQAHPDPLTIGQAPALIVGNPTMPTDPSTGVALPPLSGAETEALEIASLLNTSPLIGAAATKAAVVAQLRDVAIAHFATHGLLDDFGTGVPGALALSPTASDSGFLTAAEIFTLPLEARLVVLSACDTGRGTITGDGVVGLSRSFLTAGVESVVVSLWSVPDQPTALLMTEFYRQLHQTPNRAIALRQAMLTTRQRYAHPSNWAAFTLFGDMGAGGLGNGGSAVNQF